MFWSLRHKVERISAPRYGPLPLATWTGSVEGGDLVCALTLTDPASFGGILLAVLASTGPSYSPSASKPPYADPKSPSAPSLPAPRISLSPHPDHPPVFHPILLRGTGSPPHPHSALLPPRPPSSPGGEKWLEQSFPWSETFWEAACRESMLSVGHLQLRSPTGCPSEVVSLKASSPAVAEVSCCPLKLLTKRKLASRQSSSCCHLYRSQPSPCPFPGSGRIGARRQGTVTGDGTESAPSGSSQLGRKS